MCVCESVCVCIYVYVCLSVKATTFELQELGTSFEYMHLDYI